MMAKPAQDKEEEGPPAFATPAPQLSSVADLERRLKILDAADAPTPKVGTKPTGTQQVSGGPVAASAGVKGGKNALLARIMAAKEKSQQAQNKTENLKQEPTDLLSDFDAPSKSSDPPPAYDTNFLPPPLAAEEIAQDMDGMPPPAESTGMIAQQQMDFPPPPPINAMAPPPPLDNVMPPLVVTPSAPAASAPSFEDLLGSHQQNSLPPPPPDSLMDMPAVPPPMAAVPPPMDIDEDILAALDPAEREAILEEQRKIMEQIEKDKANNNASGAAARAMAFDQRSSAAVAQVAGRFERSAAPKRATATNKSSSSRVQYSSGSRTVDLGAGEEVPLHGQENTLKAIQEGKALIVQCMNCQNWMQVTQDATLMYCPTCGVVSPVLKEEAATSADMEVAAQMSADAQLAEKLQAEEYGRAGGAASRKKAPPKKTAKLEKGQAVEQSWYDWFMGAPAEVPPPTRGSAELRSRGLVAASTGEESYGRSPTYDESKGLIGGGARVAESKGMFACVADAVGTAATSMYTMNQDSEGNVHGVDASGLLAMPDVSRQRQE